MKTEIIPEKYTPALDRSRFELGRSIGNISFMINKHLDDEDGSFLESDLYKNLLDECIDKQINVWSVDVGVALTLGYTEKAVIKLLNNDHDYYITEA